ncbi:hypothetical protein B9479_001558 [Cryptococcus floricola]|uniref:CUE domain-containing protein n=1 Tax=Cryptococcus floricola TaxID=2591691 RepID=A0A5D3B4E3_9TREE|nr:hypothetical protein B9479_001558 [Cryptococcus floricola]
MSMSTDSPSSLHPQPQPRISRSPGGNRLSTVLANSPLSSPASSVHAPVASVPLRDEPGRDGAMSMDRTNSALSTTSTSSLPPRPLPRRRSTDASGGLDYYWSSLAGAGASSSSSSLALSLASPGAGSAMALSPPGGNASLSGSPSATGLKQVRSHGNLGINAGGGRQNSDGGYFGYGQQTHLGAPQRPNYNRADSGSSTDSQNPNPNYISSPLSISGNRPLAADHLASSPGAWSATSNYSKSATSGLSVAGYDLQQRQWSYTTDESSSSDSQYSPVSYRKKLDEPTQDSSAQDRRWEVRSSAQSGTTYVPDKEDTSDVPPPKPQPQMQDKDWEKTPREAEVEQFTTPTAAAWQERPDLRPPQFVFAAGDRAGERLSPGSSSSHTHTQGRGTPVTATSSASRYTPTNPPSSARPSSPYIHTPQSAGNPTGPSAHFAANRETPRSAPAWKSEFEQSGKSAEGEEEDTVKGRNRRTLPAVAPSSSTDLAGIMNGDQADQPILVFPVTSEPEPINKSLPTITHTPHSPFPSPPPKDDRPPTKTNLSSSSLASSSSSLSAPPARPDRSPSRGTAPTSTFITSPSISELTEMLGGAIDEIGLIDSRDTPPPTISAPPKNAGSVASDSNSSASSGLEKRPQMSLDTDVSGDGKGLEPPAELVNKGEKDPITPTSLPQRGMSLSASEDAEEQGQAGMGVASTLPASSTHTSPSDYHSPLPEHPSLPGGTVNYPPLPRPWPSAMQTTQIKSLASPGARALAYARAINELSRGDTGLGWWCTNMQGEMNRPISGSRAPNMRKLKMGSVNSAGGGGGLVISEPSNFVQGTPVSPSAPPMLDLAPVNPHPRNVSTGSEFPMRADSYSAREISQRVVDPTDQPTALPANLPYPQVQQAAANNPGFNGGGGLRPSQSMQSVSSFTSGKKGFFSAIRKGGSKKESMSLGPPTSSPIATSPGGGSVGKKDIRGLPISAPRAGTASPQKSGAESPGGLQAPRVQASISPMGPRGPRSAVSPKASSPSQSPSREHHGRSSLDTGLARMMPPPVLGRGEREGRGSLDGGVVVIGKERQMPITAPSPLSAGSGAGGVSGIDDIRTMVDVLPHVEKSVLRAYLVNNGDDQMRALGAYLEDERHGTVRY